MTKGEGTEILQNLSFNFAIRIVKLYKKLWERKEFIISKQIFRSGTSIGANIAEAQGAQSKPDFISKLHISLKEARETEYWIKILFATEYIIQKEYTSLKEDLDKIIGLLIVIIKKSKEDS